MEIKPRSSSQEQSEEPGATRTTPKGATTLENLILYEFLPDFFFWGGGYLGYPLLLRGKPVGHKEYLVTGMNHMMAPMHSRAEGAHATEGYDH